MVKEVNKNRADVLGDRIKSYEEQTTKTTLMPNLPVYARIDGRAFHTLTKGLQKPFDIPFMTTMQSTCHDLVEYTNASLGYVQSDEISLAWEDITKAPFEGKLFKLQSVLASMATASFMKYACCAKLNADELGDGDEDEDDKASAELLFQKVFTGKPISFDCRVFNVPNETELANAFIWRENDAIRNSIQSHARYALGHSKVQNKSNKELIKQLEGTEADWNNLSMVQKRGLYLQRINILSNIPDEIWDKIPDNKKPSSREVIRTDVRILDLPIMKGVSNKVGVYFHNETPIMYDNAI